MNFETFFAEIDEAPLKVKVTGDFLLSQHSLDNEALFQLPFISMVILTISKGNRKPKVSNIGQIVGECLEKSMPSFKGSSQHLGWSANLRVRTVKAIGFLELSNLIIIENRNSKVKLTELGKKVINLTLNADDDLAGCLLKVGREYRNICISHQLDLEL